MEAEENGLLATLTILTYKCCNKSLLILIIKTVIVTERILKTFFVVTR